MNIENVILNENLTLKPLPPKILNCKPRKSYFTSHLKMNAEFYKVCDECKVCDEDYRIDDSEVKVINIFYYIKKY